MEYGCKVTVNDKKLFQELQQQYCAVPDSGKCPCFNVGDEFLFYRNDERDDYWHASAGTLVKSGAPDEGCLQSPGPCTAERKACPSAPRHEMPSAAIFILHFWAAISAELLRKRSTISKLEPRPLCASSNLLRWMQKQPRSGISFRRSTGTNMFRNGCFPVSFRRAFFFFP